MHTQVDQEKLSHSAVFHAITGRRPRPLAQGCNGPRSFVDMPWLAEMCLLPLRRTGYRRRPIHGAFLAVLVILPIVLLVLLWPNLAAAESPEVWTLKRIVVANGFKPASSTSTTMRAADRSTLLPTAAASICAPVDLNGCTSLGASTKMSRGFRMAPL